MKLVYVAHPYGGKPENARTVRKIIERMTVNPPQELLDRLGEDDQDHIVYVSPIHQQGFMYDETPYLTGLAKCTGLLGRCDALLLFGDWLQSKGCVAEYGFAKAKKMPIIQGKMRIVEL